MSSKVNCLCIVAGSIYQICFLLEFNISHVIDIVCKHYAHESAREWLTEWNVDFVLGFEVNEGTESQGQDLELALKNLWVFECFSVETVPELNQVDVLIGNTCEIDVFSAWHQLVLVHLKELCFVLNAFQELN